jgi:hypothetical protein
MLRYDPLLNFEHRDVNDLTRFHQGNRIIARMTRMTIWNWLSTLSPRRNRALS